VIYRTDTVVAINDPIRASILQNPKLDVETRGPLSIRLTFRVADQICEALKYFHDQKLVHRDLKPANIVWTDEREESVQMIDFGIAKYTGEDVSGRPQ
jgi:serine/threonine protein kinase